MDAPVSEYDSSVDSLLVHPPTESEVDFVYDYDDDMPLNYSSPDYNIPSPSQPSPPNTSQEVDISLEGAQADPKRK